MKSRILLPLMALTFISLTSSSQEVGDAPKNGTDINTSQGTDNTPPPTHDETWNHHYGSGPNAPVNGKDINTSPRTDDTPPASNPDNPSLTPNR